MKVAFVCCVVYFLDVLYEAKEERLMWRPSPPARPSVRELVPATKLLSLFHETPYRSYLQNVFERGGFRENRITDIHTLLVGVNEFLPVISIFLDRLG